jgi:hypothetical protein
MPTIVVVRRALIPTRWALDVRALPHHPDEVLADVVEVALDRPEDRGVLGTDAGLDEDGFEDGGGLLHRPGGDQHLGDVDLVALELGADDLHRRRHRAEHRPRVHPLVDRLPGDRGRRRPIARLDRRRECRKIRHVLLLLVRFGEGPGPSRPDRSAGIAARDTARDFGRSSS